MPKLPTGTITLLFTDIEGSTHLLQQLGERYASVLIEYRDLFRMAFSEHHGYEVDTQGDGSFVVFARAREAILATVAVQRALTTHSWPEGVGVRVRMGLHTGEPSLVGEGYVGLDVHYAARIMQSAYGGQVLLSQTTYDLIEHDLPFGVSLRDLGKHRLKDLQHPARLYQLVIVGLPADFPPLKTLDRRPNNLPIQLTPLIGREKEGAAVQKLLQREDVRLLTLTGPGGTGKTRLGLQVAAELSDLFADGVYFVDLAPISDPTLVVSSIAQTLGIHEVAGQSLPERLKEVMQQQQVLLVLDNFEQVVSAAQQVADLLGACQKLKLLVTSREVLRVRAEHEFAVPPLALPDPIHLPGLAQLSQYASVALFIQRAQVVKPEFTVTTANAPAIAAICVWLDGLPLAIEFAAARVNLFSPHALLARLEQRLKILTSGPRDAPARQQTLRNTLTWSYDLLTPQEQQLFRWLSVFISGCTLEAVEAICAALSQDDAAGQVLEGVSSLLDKSLLKHIEQEDRETRVLMLETIREYGLEALAVGGETEDTRQAHAAYYLQLAEEAEKQLIGPQQAEWLDRLEREHDNQRAALRWLLEQGEDKHHLEMALRLSAALRRFWVMRGHMREGLIFMEGILAKSEGIAAPVKAKVLFAVGELAGVQGELGQAEVLLEESLAICRELGDSEGTAIALYRLGTLNWDRSKLPVARALTEEALALFRELKLKLRIASAIYQLASIASELGDYIKASAQFEECLAMFREMGNKTDIARSLERLAWVFLISLGDQTIVRSLLEESRMLLQEVGDKSILGLLFLARMDLVQGDAVKARLLAEESVTRSKESGDHLEMPRALSLLAQVEAHLGDYTAARTLYEESLTMARKADLKGVIAPDLEGLASVMALQGELLWAAKLWGAAESIRTAMGAPLPPVELPEYNRSVAATRTSLGEHTFTKAWVEGRTMTLEQVLVAHEPTMLGSTSNTIGSH